VFKYLFIANLYSKAKRSLLGAGVMLVLLVTSTFIMNDLLTVASGSEKYLFLLVKWVLVLFFMAMFGYYLLKVFNVATAPIRSKPKESEPVVRDDKKERILAKEQLLRKSDRIMDKYVKATL